MSRVIRLNKHVVHLVLTYCFVSFSRILKVTQLCIMQHLGEWQIQGLLTNLSLSQYVTNLLSSPRFCIHLLLHGARNCVLFKHRTIKNKYYFIYIALFLSLLNSALQRLNKHKVLENPNWQEAGQLAIYTAQPRSWTRGVREQIQRMAGWRTWTRDHQITSPAP